MNKTIFMMLCILRPIVADRRFGLFTIFINVWYACKLLKRSNYLTYKANLQSYNDIQTIADLVVWFKDIYKYKADPGKGFFDHDKNKIEFFYDFGDCDSMGLWSRLWFQKHNINAKRVFMTVKGQFAESTHTDCFYYQNDKVYLFNYGKIIEADTEAACIDKLCDAWYAKGDKKAKVIWVTLGKFW